jgi:hypothetical protein
MLSEEKDDCVSSDDFKQINAYKKKEGIKIMVGNGMAIL